MDVRAVTPALSRFKLCICGRCTRCRARSRKGKSQGTRVTHWRDWSEQYRYEHFAAIARELLGPDANLQSAFPRAHEIPARLPDVDGRLIVRLEGKENPIAKRKREKSLPIAA